MRGNCNGMKQIISAFAVTNFKSLHTYYSCVFGEISWNPQVYNNIVRPNITMNEGHVNIRGQAAALA